VQYNITFGITQCTFSLFFDQCIAKYSRASGLLKKHWDGFCKMCVVCMCQYT